MTLVIAIDGPAAAGKGTLARRLAEAFSLPYLDTGRLYRAVGRLVLDDQQDPADTKAALRAAHALRPADLNRADLRGAEADRAASQVAALPEVRAALLAFQRGFAATGAVLDGRDIGTVIVPDAPVKLFVTASLAARAYRRWLERSRDGDTVTLAEVEADMHRRDQLDATRAAAPLRPAPDATVLDTTTLDADAAFAAAVHVVRATLA
jgi:cytidylate kinase